jgi:hypothetical protein
MNNFVYSTILIKCAILFLFIQCNKSEIRSFEPKGYSDGVKFSIRKSLIQDDSLTSISWRYFSRNVSDVKSPTWVTRMLSSQNHSSATCAIEILSIIPKKFKTQFGASHAIVYSRNLNYFSVKCYYSSVAVGWERKPDSSSPPRPAFFYCPIYVASSTENSHPSINNTSSVDWKCNEIHSHSVNITLFSTTIDPRRNLFTWFVTNSPKSRELSNQRRSNRIGICTNAMHKTETSAALLQTFIRHHTSLEFDR